MDNYNISGGVLCKDNKELVYLVRVDDGYSNFNISPTRKDAMLYFLRDALNSGEFDKYYNEYMKK